MHYLHCFEVLGIHLAKDGAMAIPRVKHFSFSAEYISAVCCLLFLFPHDAMSLTTNWTGATNTSWTNSSNWNNGVPGSADTAMIATGNANVAHISTLVNAINQLILGNASNNGVLSIDTGGTLSSTTSVIGEDDNPGGDTSQVIVSGTWNAGTLVLGQNSGSSGTLSLQSGAVVTANSVQVAGGGGSTGNISLGANAVLQTNTITGGNGDDRLMDFRGGTLKALSNQANFMSGLSFVQLMAGGVIVDSNGFNIGVQGGFFDLGIGGDFVKQGAGTLTFNGANSYSGGKTMVNAGTLKTGAANVLSPASSVVVQDGATLDLAGFPQTIPRLTVNGGTVTLAGASPGNVFTITGPLTGAGTFALATNLGARIGDFVEVGGTSSGNHVLSVSNQGGAPSGPGQTLEVVATTDGVAQFSLQQGHIESGLFDYTLQQGLTNVPGTATNWYLVNLSNQFSHAGQAIIATTPGIIEASWFAQLDNLHKRMGQLRINPSCPNNEHSDLWIRYYGNKQNIDHHNTEHSFHEHLHGFDVGIDKIWDPQAYGQWWTGAFVGYGKLEQSFDSPIDSAAKSRYAGLYATWLDRCGWYVDMVARAHHFDTDFESTSAQGEFTEGDYDNWGLGLSAEVGRRFNLGQGGYLEPQVQIAYTHLTDATYRTSSDIRVRTDDTDLLQTRASLIAGFVFGTATNFLEPYAKIGVINQESRGGRLHAEGLSRRPNLDGTRVEGGAGMVYQLNQAVQVHVDYEASSGHRNAIPWKVNAGFRWIV